ISMAGSGEVEVKAVLAFCSFIRQPIQTEVIDEITMETYQTEELERRPGIIGYIVKEGEELWTLAKRYCTTVERIREVNGLTEDQVKPGDKILIFKENMSIL
ncbi:LysM domain protein, partial [gut metagenome]